MLYRNYLKDKYQNAAVNIVEAEGISCVLESSKGKNIRNYEIYGNSAQDGTPSPDFPSEIRSVGDLTTKNLFNKSISTNQSIRNETVNTDNSYSIGILSINKICEILKPNTTYTISCEFECESIPADTTLYMNLLGFSIYTTVSGYSTASAVIKKQLSVGETYYYSQTFTTPLKFDSGGNYRFLLYRNAYKDADGNYQFPAIICRNIQIEEGSIATDYEPYHKYKIPITVSGKNLIDVSALSNIENYFNAKEGRSGLEFFNVKFPAGTYTASVDIVNTPIASISATYIRDNTIYPIKVIVNTTDTQGEKSVTFTAPQDWYIRLYYGGSSNTAARLSALMACIDSLQLEYGSSATVYEPYKGSETTHIYLDEPLRKVGDYADYIDFKGQRVVRKVVVSDNTGTKPISESLVALTIPTEEPIPLPTLKTFKGISIISVDTSVQPSNIKAKYVKK